jgi:exonuclease SbcC
MILTRIQIENYKQYQGSHEIEIPQDAIVGVIGENGSGKTTLFEAIEWCLYSPRSISPTDVRPRGSTGHTTVTVFLETADQAQQYVVQRVLKRTPSAAIYRQDEHGGTEIIAQGPRQVTDYVATKLIGLSHTAFTATFFTRQRELHLFGSETPQRRREAIGRMLGLETIRSARRSIMNDRAGAQAEARAMRTQYERESEGHDFAAELQVAEATIVDCTTRIGVATAEIASTEAARAEAETIHAGARERRDLDAQLGQEFGHQRNEAETRKARVQQICADIEEISSSEDQRRNLAPVASRLDDLAAAVARQDAERNRHERRTELARSLRDIAMRRQDTLQTLHSTVASVTVTRAYPGWWWSREDDGDALAGTNRLLSVLDEIDLAGAERHEQEVRDCIDAAAALAESEMTLARYAKARAAVDDEERAFLANGEPRERLAALDRLRERLVQEQTRVDAQRTNLEDGRDKATAMLGNLTAQQFGDDCPTCGRPFSEDDAAVVIDAMRQRIHSFTTDIQEAEAKSRDIARQISGLDEDRKAIHDEQARLDHVRSRIQKSGAVLEAQKERMDVARATFERARAALGSDTIPTPEDLRIAQRHTRELRALAMTRSSIIGCQERLTAMARDDLAATTELATLADVSFDPDAYERLRHEFQEADRARVAIAHIDRAIARRPALEIELRSCQERLATIAAEIAGLEARREELRYDQAELPSAQSALSAAQEAVQAAHARYHQAYTILREAEIHRDQVRKEQARLEHLARDADAKQVEADELDLMAREFNEFERFAVQRKVPILNEYTSSLVDAITLGKYQRVEFDQDFGIVVHDGDEGETGYPVDTFSGGERDAIMLAARLAMSRLIGRQATNPPGFLVLDEVFGSLDTERRAQLLGLLGSLSNTFDDVRQTFIISHVDDVRTSPILDEIWRVEENAEGASQVLLLEPGVEIDAP